LLIYRTSLRLVHADFGDAAAYGRFGVNFWTGVVTFLMIKYLRKILVKISKIRQNILNKLNFRLIFAVVTPQS